MWYQAQKRKGPPRKEDLESCMNHELPGTPNLAVISFNNSFHGRTLGELFFLNSAAAVKVRFNVYLDRLDIEILPVISHERQ